MAAFYNYFFLFHFSLICRSVLILISLAKAKSKLTICMIIISRTTIFRNDNKVRPGKLYRSLVKLAILHAYIHLNMQMCSLLNVYFMRIWTRIWAFNNACNVYLIWINESTWSMLNELTVYANIPPRQQKMQVKPSRDVYSDLKWKFLFFFVFFFRFIHKNVLMQTKWNECKYYKLFINMYMYNWTPVAVE